MASTHNEVPRAAGRVFGVVVRVPRDQIPCDCLCEMYVESSPQYCCPGAGSNRGPSAFPVPPVSCQIRDGTSHCVVGTRSGNRSSERTFCGRVGDRFSRPVSRPVWTGAHALGVLRCIQPDVDCDLDCINSIAAICSKTSVFCSLVSCNSRNAQRYCSPGYGTCVGWLLPGPGKFTVHWSREYLPVATTQRCDGE